VPTGDFAAMVERIEDLELHLASAIKERDEYRSRIDAMFWNPPGVASTAPPNLQTTMQQI
jgi:hypothetical protein